MSIKLEEKAPNFQAETSQGKIDFYDYLGDRWGILFSHPADYTPVCTTELGRMSQLQEEFSKRNTKLIALSVDNVDSHKGWISDINETQNTEVDYPIIADADKKVANLYGMMHPAADDTKTVRSVFIISPDKKVKLTITYPASVGRNFNEILRVLEALQLTAEYPVATPVEWEDGDDVIVSPRIKTEDIADKFPKGFKEIKPYLRTTPQPNK